MRRVLLLGGSGQVGQALIRSASPDMVVTAPGSADADMRSARSLRDVVSESQPELVINCAAFTRVDDAESEPEAAFAINAEAAGVLALAAGQCGARFLHVSTDYVFDGTGMPPYGPEASVAPLSVYGASKLAGEQAVMAANATAAVVRTAWVHSGGGVNFVATAVRVLRQDKVMRVVDDQVSTPTRALSLAAALWGFAEKPELSGVFHFTDAGVASWYDVAECVLHTLQRNGLAQGASVVPVDSSAFPRPALRPHVSLLDKHTSWNALGITPVHWRDGVTASTLELLHA